MANTMIEEWKAIKDFPNYEISTKGNIRNIIRQSKLLRKQINNVGYEYVILSNKTTKHKTLTVHRLVARTFLDNYNNNLEVNHINGNKTDNRIENLEMISHKENVKKRYEIGIVDNNYKKVNQYDLNGNYINSWDKIIDIERKLGFYHQHISSCCKHKLKTAYGYIWRYAS